DITTSSKAYTSMQLSMGAFLTPVEMPNRSNEANGPALPPNLVALSGILLASVRGGLAFFGEADPPHGRGGVRGAKVGNEVAVGAGVAVAAGIGVATCACAPAKKATKPSRTH